MSEPLGGDVPGGVIERPAVALARAGLIVAAAFLVSRLLGWLRMVVITATFGASPELDAFLAAFRLPDLLYQLVAAGAVSSALVPVVAGLLARDQDSRAWRMVTTVTNLMLCALAALGAAGVLFAPALVPLIAPGFDAQRTELAVELTRIMMVAPALLALGAVASSVLNAAGRFGAAAVAPATYNLGIIAGAILLAPMLGVTALALGTVAGAGAHLAVQLPAVARYTSFRWRPRIDLTDPEARGALALMAPRALGLGASQITLIVATSLASGLGTGSITAFLVAFTLLQIPLGLIAQPLGIVVLPSLSRAAALGAHREFGSLVERSLRLLAYAMIFVTFVSVVVRREVVTLLFGYGRFDASSIALASDTLLFFLVGLPAHSLIAVLARGFYAQKDTRAPVIAALLAVAINTTFGVLTIGILRLAGPALGIALGAWAETLLLLALLERRTAGVAIGTTLRSWLVFGVGGSLAAAASWLALNGLATLAGPAPGKLTLAFELSLVGLLAAAVYAAYGRLLRLPELALLARLAREARLGGPAGR